MINPTPLDKAQAAMSAAPSDDALRLRFYARMAEAELFLLLTGDAVGDEIEPDVFETGGATYVLAFDREDRMTAFTGKAVPYIALSGRTIIEMLAGNGIGLGLNLGEPRYEMLLPEETVNWLGRTLAGVPEETEAKADRILPPKGLPEPVLTALDERLASAIGLASAAYLAGIRYKNGTSGHLLAFVSPLPGAEAALARTVQDALTFSGVEAGQIDVTFVDTADASLAHLKEHGLRFDLPQPEAEALIRTTPGGDPEKPPRLR